MYFISSVDKYDIGVTDTKSGVTNYFDRIGIELFLQSGHPVLRVVPYFDLSSGQLMYYFAVVSKANCRQVSECVSFSYEGVVSNLQEDSLFGFVQLFNFRSEDEMFCSDFLILYYLLQVYDCVTMWLRDGVSATSVQFNVYYRGGKEFTLSYTLHNERVFIGCPIEGSLCGTRLTFRYEDGYTGVMHHLCIDVSRALASVRREVSCYASVN